MRPLTVLIVEDDPSARYAMVKLLEQAGHIVIQAFTADAAMAVLSKSDRIDVVLLDIILGEGLHTGWSVAAYMQAQPRRKDTPIIVISGLEPDDIREGAQHYANFLARAAMILGKPIDGRMLLDVLEKVCPEEPPA